MKSKLSNLSKLLLFIAVIGLLIVLFKPIWRIELTAPQYPEGLSLTIHANGLKGNVDIINGLNHYIGMKTLHSKDFIEFTVLPYIISIFIIAFALVALLNRRRWLNILFVAFVAFGIIAMYDFWRWEYNYGHNLNPAAAIIVPGMAYQPPLIGFKQLLNFGAYSIPAIGGWIFIAVGVILLGIVIYEWRRKKKINVKTNAIALLIIGGLTLSLSSCNTGPQPLRIGNDNCDFCKMTISDNRFGAEIVTKKSKVYKFDDEHCIVAFLNAKRIAPEQIAAVYFTNFNSPHQLLNVEQAHFLQSPTLKSPMNGNIAAFVNEDSLVNMLPQFKGNKISWEDMQK